MERQGSARSSSCRCLSVVVDRPMGVDSKEDSDSPAGLFLLRGCTSVLDVGPPVTWPLPFRWHRGQRL